MISKPTFFHIKAPAKINYNLHVAGVRPDGYCEISSLMLKTSLHDELTVSIVASSKIETEVQCAIDPQFEDWIKVSDLPSASENLAGRAAKLYLAAIRETAKVKISIVKRIPIGAGLGGGSSDAASTLLALQELFSHPLSSEGLQHLAEKLGSDLPFFLTPGNALASGRGEKLSPVNWPKKEFPLILEFPGFPIPTAQIYADYKSSNSSFVSLTEETPDAKNRLSIADSSNDLERFIVARYPELSQVKALMLTDGAQVAGITGTGSTVFGLFETLSQARVAASKGRRCFEIFAGSP